MNLMMMTPVRLLGDGLTACLAAREGASLRGVLPDLKCLREALFAQPVEMVLIDVTQGIDLHEVRAIVSKHPDIAFVALGMEDQRQDVIRCGRAGFSGYVSRGSSIDELCQAMSDVAAGRLACRAEISSGLLRALFRMDFNVLESSLAEALTHRESEVLQLIGNGLSNKEIARDLDLSVATVKHHVHKVLAKLQVGGRAHAMRMVRESPWIASSPLRQHEAASPRRAK